ncbi:hypothetical protein N7527_012233 [Penicillium freii]|nr:hypothetical protein N7527_012233 [Penicillium freii]
MTYLISHSDGFLVTDLSVVYLLPTVLLGLFVVLAWRRRKEPTIPIVNSYPGDITLKRAQSRFTSDARGLIKEGIEKFNGPFRIITTLGSRVILPASYTEWLKNCLDLDHQALVHDQYFAVYPGMEGQRVITDPRKILINVTKTKLNNQSSPSGPMIDIGVSQIWSSITECALFHEHITEALEEIWMDRVGIYRQVDEATMYVVLWD